MSSCVRDKTKHIIPGTKLPPATYTALYRHFPPWLLRFFRSGLKSMARWYALRSPMIDFSSAFSSPTWPSFSFLILSSNSSAISLIFTCSFFRIRFLAVGIFCKTGTTWLSMNRMADKKLGFVFAKESNNAATEECFPRSVPKSCEKPAIPMLSSLILRWYGDSRGRCFCTYEIWFILCVENRQKNISRIVGTIETHHFSTSIIAWSELDSKIESQATFI